MRTRATAALAAGALAAGVLAASGGAAACAAPRGPGQPSARGSRASLAIAPPRLAAWRAARARLEAIRREVRGTGPRTMRIALRLREPTTGRTLEARGAVAVAPPEVLRMVLLGPGGTTALDLWARGDRFRFEVPALGLLRRGDRTTPRAELRGLPVEFLSFWLLHPANGTLLWHDRDSSGGDRFLLRDGDAVVELRAREGGGVWARRTTWSAGGGPRELLDEETVEAGGLGCAPSRYRQASTGLEVRVTCEGVERDRAPSPRAFDDPDAVRAGAGG